MAALEVQVQYECRYLAALEVTVQALGPALGLSEECALALLVLWVGSPSRELSPLQLHLLLWARLWLCVGGGVGVKMLCEGF